MVEVLPSISSAVVELGPTLFADFSGTTTSSDCPFSFIIGVPSSQSPDADSFGLNESIVGSPVSRQESFQACKWSQTTWVLSAARGNAADNIAFRTLSLRRHPRLIFRGSIHCLPVPLSTLRVCLTALVTHDSGSLWFAIPSTCNSYICYLLAILNCVR